jgi:transposase-like protein
MGHRIRLALHAGSFERMLDGEVEVDETFIGGKARNMHSDVKARRITGRGPTDKTIVIGMLERGGIVKTKVVESRKKRVLQREVRATVAAGSALYSDDLASYQALQRNYAHQTVDHAIQYVDGVVHTNTMENFWALLKRALSGTYVSVEPFHLFRYLDEQAYRYNERRGKDGDRFFRAISRIFGKRLTYNQLRGKTKRGPKRREPAPA